ncbi:MAG: hypothetical protein J0H37_02220, partial [Hyphomicrobium denitrificans]|nr:hypothetical protein [Hyphomicrobium denitrificans]
MRRYVGLTVAAVALGPISPTLAQETHAQDATPPPSANQQVQSDSQTVGAELPSVVVVAPKKV